MMSLDPVIRCLMCLFTIACGSSSAPASSQFEPLVGLVRNDGQWNQAAQYVGRSRDLTVRCERGGIALAVRSKAEESYVTRIQFGSSLRTPEAVVTPRTERYNFFLGSDPSAWLRDVESFDEVIYPDVYGRTDVRVLIRDGRPSYDLLLDDASELEQVELTVDGAIIEGVDAGGSLLTRIGSGVLRHVRPIAYQTSSGMDRSSIRCEFRVIDSRRFGFKITGSALRGPLVVDPGLEWSTYFGGSVYSDPNFKYGTTIDDVYVAKDRSTLIVGATSHLDFPTTVGAYSTTMQGKQDAYLTRLAPNGATLEFSTFFGGKQFPFPPGGGGGEIAKGVIEESTGSYLVGGFTNSADYPITPGAYFSPPPITQQRAFATRFSSDGSALLASAVVGAGENTFTLKVAVAPNGDIGLAASTNDGAIPSAALVYDATYNGGPSDIALFVLSGNLSTLRFASFFGTNHPVSTEPPTFLELTDDEIMFGSSTQSIAWPTTPNALQPQKSLGGVGSDANDATFTVINRNTGTLVYSTYLGSSAWGDSIRGSDIDENGNVYLTGRAGGADFPVTPGAYQSTVVDAGNGDAFITCFDENFALVYSTYFGWFGEEYGSGVRVTDDGFLHLAGESSSGGASFPGTPGALQPHWYFSGDVHLFCARLDRLATKLFYMTGLGGSSNEHPTAFDVDGTGAATLASITTSTDYPTTPGAFDTTYTLIGQNMAASRLDLLPTGVTKFGVASAGCAGPSYATVSSWPKAGNKSFTIQCARSPKNSPGYVLVSTSKLTSPLEVVGVSLWVNPNSAILIPAHANDEGIADVVMPVRPQYAGSTIYAQFVWPDACGFVGYSASTALEITAIP